MKIPNSFVLEKNYEQNIDGLLKGPKEKENPFALQDLLESCQEFTKKGKSLSLNETYDTGMKLASNISYNSFHIEELSQEIIPEKYPEWLGIYFSALVNKIITPNEVITLNFEKELDCLGMYLSQGTLTIQGDTRDNTGYCMQGGKITINGTTGDSTGDNMQGGSLIVQGNAGADTGEAMENGKITVGGNAGDWTGYFMESGKIVIKGNTRYNTGGEMQGGEIIVKGKIKGISTCFQKGTIIQGNKIVKQR